MDQEPRLAFNTAQAPMWERKTIWVRKTVKLPESQIKQRSMSINLTENKIIKITAGQPISKELLVPDQGNLLMGIGKKTFRREGISTCLLTYVVPSVKHIL